MPHWYLAIHVNGTMIFFKNGGIVYSIEMQDSSTLKINITKDLKCLTMKFQPSQFSIRTDFIVFRKSN